MALKWDGSFEQLDNTVNPVLSGHSKIDTTKILMINGSLKKVESIVECSSYGAFCNNFVLHKAIIGIEIHFEWPLETGFTVFTIYAQKSCLAFEKNNVVWWECAPGLSTRTTRVTTIAQDLLVLHTNRLKIVKRKSLYLQKTIHHIQRAHCVWSGTM